MICDGCNKELQVGDWPFCPHGRASQIVVGDDIPGGMWVKHGICNEDGTPRKYYSRSEMAAEAAKRGLMNLVEHVPVPGTDKSPHTVRWVSAPLMGEEEEERVKRWHEYEAKNFPQNRLGAGSSDATGR